MSQQVSFYILTDQTPEARALFACRLADKAWRSGLSTHIHTAGEQDMKDLDNLLWSFREDSFLPHIIVSETEQTVEPVTLGHTLKQLEGRKGLLINLGEAIPDNTDSYSRIAEIVIQEESALKLARSRFREYKERALSPIHQKVGQPA
ncbi:MAG: DNA polymerase III subunit chi [Desulfovibrionales bacterium]|nr:DNA polymerase III subunit chi [Desulfovibrionales bacterium]